MKQSIITLCRETVTYSDKLEVDGIICLAIDGIEQHVVKIHEVFIADSTVDALVKEESRLPTPDITRVPSPQISLPNNVNSTPRSDSASSDISPISSTSSCAGVKNTSQLFENVPFKTIPEIKPKPVAESTPTSRLPPGYTMIDKDRYRGMEGLTISNAKDIPCKKCGKTIENVAQYENHNMSAHGHFTCMICLSTFTSRNNMKRHIRLHTGVKPYVCHKCPESFSRNDDFKRHLLRHTFQKPFRCTICQSGFTDRGQVRAHMMKEHNCAVFHSCPHCGECFDDSKKMHDHKKTHTEWLEYRCSLCSFTGSNALMYNKHMLTHGPPKQYRCNQCEMSFPDPFTYTSHLKKHKGDELAQNFVCCFCDLAFNSFEQFQRHEHSHVHSKQHTCKVCQKHFRYPSNLREHMLTHIPKSDLMDTSKDHTIDAKNYHPNADNVVANDLQDTSTENNSESEMEDVHDDAEENNNVVIKSEPQFDVGLDYWCTECHHGFGSESDLQSHIMTQHEQNGYGHSPRVSLSPSHDISEEYEEMTMQTEDLAPYSSQTQLDSIVISQVRSVHPLTYDTNEEGTKPNKRKSNHAARTFLLPKRNKMYEEETVVDGTDVAQETEMSKHVLNTTLSGIKNEPEHKEFGETTIKRNKRATVVAKPSALEVHDIVMNLKTERTSPVNCNEQPIDLGIKNHVKLEMTSITASLRGQPKERQNLTTSPLHEEESLAMAQFYKTKSQPKILSYTESEVDKKANGKTDDDFSNGSNGEIAHYSKTSVLGMDTDFSTSPNRSSPTTINLKVRNPGFEKVVTPDILFETKAPFTCEICSETFPDFVNFDQHGVKVHRRFICSYCGKAFTSRPNRERHVRYHTGEKPYKCDLCTVSFFRGDDLKYHRTTKHADVKPFTCAACQTSFSYPKDLEKHLRVHPDHKL